MSDDNRKDGELAPHPDAPVEEEHLEKNERAASSGTADRGSIVERLRQAEFERLDRESDGSKSQAPPSRPNPANVSTVKPEAAIVSRSRKQVWKGVGLVFLLHLMLIFIPVAYLFIGLIQWLYLIPIILINKKDPSLVRGIWIAATATFVLNAVFYLIVITT
ncbi:hypothetical protein [Paenibacillus koleovorans]|uniref:hypothetical protein n=1 Tax=Paenibacillus koleovorans TaxID=121608 RepID=UPI000FD883AC|nr:hypothetical protein [Paenibacillus koleovorans]